ncbi:MAG TPA: hypothetical protein DCZ03_13775 [Gammaproteobacteria bacterium]|nr:hypothetical protein [Gammaproteobacteria bacterium]
MNSNSKNQQRVQKIINPITISIVLMFVAIIYLSGTIGITIKEALGWFLLQSFQECINFDGMFFVTSYSISYLLMIICLVLTMFVIESESDKQYIICSLLGVLAVVVWFGWGMLTFLICGLRAH